MLFYSLQSVHAAPCPEARCLVLYLKFGEAVLILYDADLFQFCNRLMVTPRLAYSDTLRSKFSDDEKIKVIVKVQASPWRVW